MEIGEKLIVGRMGKQPMPISDTTVSPQHITIKRIDEENYQITDMDSHKGVFVFGIRIVRKTVKENTPFLLGGYKTSIAQLLHDPHSVNLTEIWDTYDKQKRQWDRYAQFINSIRMIIPILSITVSAVIGQNLYVQVGIPVIVTLIVILLSEKLSVKKNLRMAELNSDLQKKYLCPHCQKFLGFVPYKVLKANNYCPNSTCGVPLP